MAYEGDILTFCPGDVDLSVVYAVIVSGDFPNPCGHALLYIPRNYAIDSSDGYYLQVAGAYSLPRIMRHDGYRRYLKENKKKELKRYPVTLTKPAEAYNRLIELMGKKWAWLVLPNNCAAFVEDIVRAGGSSAGLYSNCPTLEKFN